MLVVGLQELWKSAGYLGIGFASVPASRQVQALSLAGREDAEPLS